MKYREIFVWYLIISFLIPLRRVIYSSWDDTSYQAGIFNAHTWMPVLAIILITVLWNGREKNPLVKFLDKILDLRFVNPVVLGILSLFLILTVARVPGWWWTWTTLGIHFVTIALVMEGTKHKLTPLFGMILGIGVTSLAAGVWELVYQTGYFFRYDFYVPGISMIKLASQYTFLIPLLLGGTGVMTMMSFVGFKPVYSKYFWGYMAAYVIATVAWFYMGFWVDIFYNWTTLQWEYTDPNYIQMFIYRSSKVWMALGFASLYWKESFSMRRIYSYALIPVWCVIFAATSVFLLVTWIQSLLKKAKYDPFFIARTIHFDPTRPDQMTHGHKEA